VSVGTGGITLLMVGVAVSGGVAVAVSVGSTTSVGSSLGLDLAVDVGKAGPGVSVGTTTGVSVGFITGMSVGVADEGG
jgi:hypothetical protein